MALPGIAPKPPKTESNSKPTKENPPKPEKVKKEKVPKVKVEKAPKVKKEKVPRVKKEKVPRVKKEKTPKVPREKGEKKPLNKKLLLIIAVIVLLLLLLGGVFFLINMLGDKKAEPAEGIPSSSASSDIGASGADESDASASGDGASGADENSKPEGGGASAPAQGDASSSASSSESSSSGMVGGVNGISEKPAKPFTFSEETLSLPAYTPVGSSAIERAVRTDIQTLLNAKDDRPGVGIAAIVIADSYTMDDGTLRVLAYVWGNRYAVSENTLFDYGSMAGPVAVDYTGGTLKEIHLPQEGDAYDASVQEMCGPKVDIADKMLRKSYDLELRGQMMRNVSEYITRNNIAVEYFRAGAQTYHKNGKIYILPEGGTPSNSQPTPESLTQGAQSSSASSEASVAVAGKTIDDALLDDYEYYQNLPF